MKHVIILAIILLQVTAGSAQSVSISASPAVPDPSAMLDIKSTNSGILIPRMNTAQRLAIVNAAEGLMVYDTETANCWVHKNGNWAEIPSGGGAGAGAWTSSGTNIYNSNVGNVGIGSVNPVAKLTIQTGINTTGWTHIGGPDSIIVTEGIGGVSASIGTITNHAFRIHTNGTGKFSVYPGGEVVVGSNATGSFGKLTVQTTNNTYGISHLGDNGNILATLMGGTSAGIGTFSHTNMRIFSNGFSRIFISEATGNVGIAVADDNPLYKLDVGDRMRIRSGPNGNTAGVWLNNSTNTGSIAFMGIADDFTTGFYGNIAGWGLIMNTNTGNVGIGTINPTYKLSVNGIIRTKEVIVEAGWADYVFEKNYYLNPLESLEKYIRQNKHLPNIPSAAEIEQNGLRVGDVQKKMMEKIEELTLYIIEMNKEISSIKKEINFINTTK